jgi:hypothetical protein
MQQWEYMTWRATGHRASAFVSSVNGQSSEEKPCIEDALRDAGADGWELVAVTQDQMYYSYFFRRPKE